MVHPYKCTDEGGLSWHLGIKYERNRKERTIDCSQTQYIEDLLKANGMEDCNPVLTPLEPHARLSKDQCPEVPDDERGAAYRRIVGGLRYLADMTRPDIAFAVGELGRFNANPGAEHMAAAKRVLRYLKGTKSWKLRFDGKKDFKLVGYSDSDWAGDLDTRRSTTGYVFTLCGAPVSTKSKRQKMVTLSSTEAEYVAGSKAAQDAVYLRQLLKDLGFEQKEPTVLFEDNEGCIHFANDPVSRERTRHIDIRRWDLRGRVADGTVRLVPCATGDMVADIFTKSLPAPAHHKLCREMFFMPDDPEKGTRSRVTFDAGAQRG